MIVCGLHEIGRRTVEQLHLAGARVVVVDDAVDESFGRLARGWGIPTLPRGGHLGEPLLDAGIAGAVAVVVTETSDLRTLETVLLVHDLRPELRVVAHLDNPAVANAVEEVTGAATVLDVGALFAPSVIEVCVGRRAHDIVLASTRFVTTEVTAPRPASLRDLFGSLAPLGVVKKTDDAVIVCPGRDLHVEPGDRVTLIGTEAELEAANLAPRSGAAVELQYAGARALARLAAFSARVAGETDRALRIALLLGLGLLLGSTVVLHLAYRVPGHAGHLPVIDDAPAELSDPLDRPGQIVDDEIRQRERVARSDTPLVDPDLRAARVRLPPASLARSPVLELDLEQPRPEAPGPLVVVGRKLDQ